MRRHRVLVTGGAGFIGSNIVQELMARGEEVTVLDNLSTGFLKNLKPYLGDIQWIKGDIRDRRTVKRALKGVGLVLHQAAIRSVAASVEDPFLCHAVDATGTLLLLEEALQARVERFVYASTSAAYGDVRRFPQKESDYVKPLSPYGVSKLAGEHYCLNYFHNQKFPTVCLRYFNVYGPRQNPESKYSTVIPAFVDILQRGRKPVVDGTGKQSRDFVFVKDVVRANMKAAFGDDRPLGKVFNIATAKAYSVLYTLRLVARSLGVKPMMRFGPPRPGDAAKTLADITQAAKYLRWKPTVRFEDGIDQTVKWFRSGRS